MVFKYFIFFALIALFIFFAVKYTIGWKKILENILPFIVVEKQKASIIDNRLGNEKFSLFGLGIFKDRVVYEGIHFYIPIIETVVTTVSLKEQIVNPPSQKVITIDKVNIEVDLIGFFKIKDPMKAIFEIEKYDKSLETLIIGKTNEILGLMKFDEIQSNQNKIGEEIKKEVQEDAKRWGLELVKIDFENISYPQTMKEAMEKEEIAKKNANAKIIEAEGQHKVLELQADSEKILIEKKALALHKAIKEFKEIMPNIEDEKIMQFLTSNAHIDSIKSISKSDGTKFVLYPTDSGQPMDKLVSSEYLSGDKKG